MIILNPCATKFFESINPYPLAFSLIDSIFNDHKLNDDVLIYFLEEKNKAYLKINSRRIPMVLDDDNPRDLFSMYWHPSKNIFVCRSAFDIIEKAWVSNIRKVDSPLPVKFNLNLTDKVNGQLHQWLKDLINSNSEKFEKKVMRDLYFRF